MGFRQLAHGDVADRRRHQDALGAFQRAQHDLNRKLAAILAPRGQFNARADLLRQSVFGGAQRVCNQSLREARRNNVFHALPEELVTVIAELFFGLHVQQHDVARLIYHHHRVWRGFQQPAVAPFHARQMLFRFSAHADVANRGRHQNAFGAVQGAQHDFNGKLGSVLAARDQLDARADLLRQRVFGGTQAIRHQPLRKTFGSDVLHFLAHHLVGAISKVFFGLDVQQHDIAARISHDHRVRRGFQQPAVAPFQQCQMLFRFSAHADVANGGRYQNAFGAVQGAQHDFNGKLGSVLAARDQLDARADLLRQRVFHRTQAVGDQTFRKTLGNDVLHFLAHQLIAAISKLFFRLDVQQHDIPARIYHDHRVRRGFQQPAVAAFHQRQMLFRFSAYADVANGGRYQNAFGAVQGAQHDFNGKLGSVLAARDQLDAGADLLRQRVFHRTQAVSDQPFRKTLGNDVLHFLAHQLVAAISKLFFGLDVQQHDIPARIYHDHRVRRGFQQPAVAAFHQRQMLFRFSAYADVANGGRYQNAFGAVQGAQHDFNGKLGSVLAARDQLDARADLLRQRVFHRTQAVGDQTFRKTLGNDVLHFLAHQLIAAISKLFFRLDVQQHDIPARIYHDHRVRRGFQQPAVAAFHQRQMLFRFSAYADVANGGR